MKKILALALALLMLVSVISCGTTPNGDDVSTDTPASGAPTTDTEAEEIKKPYDGIFQVGYAREDITPPLGATLLDNVPVDSVLDHIYATSVAFYDGKNTVAMVSVDVRAIGEDHVEKMKTRITRGLDIPGKNIIIAATHNHSAPSPNNGTPVNTAWTPKLYTAVYNAVDKSIKDLADAELYVSTEKTTGMAFVRRYIHEDGSFSSIHWRNPSKSPIVGYETEADDSLQIIRAVRKDKQDVILTNWQAHVAHAVGLHPTSISADIVYYLRYMIERADDDALVAFFAGASANINLSAKAVGTQKYGSYKEVGIALARLISKSAEDPSSMTKVEPGEIKIERSTYKAKSIRDSAERLAQANEVHALGDPQGDAYLSGLDKYGFKSKHEVSKLIGRNKNPETQDFPLSCIAFGDLAFVSVPYEMFDTNGMQVKDASPYEMTFVLSCAGGSYGYMPAAHAIEHGGYEVYSTYYEYGTAEAVAEKLIEMLNKSKK